MLYVTYIHYKPIKRGTWHQYVYDYTTTLYDYTTINCCVTIITRQDAATLHCTALSGRRESFTAVHRLTDCRQTACREEDCRLQYKKHQKSSHCFVIIFLRTIHSFILTFTHSFTHLLHYTTLHYTVVRLSISMLIDTQPQPIPYRTIPCLP